MRLAATLATLTLAAGPGVAPRGAHLQDAAAQGEVVCTVDDPRAVELSGLVATTDGYVSIVDSQFDPSQVVIVYLDTGCRVTRTQDYPTLPRDPEDLAVAPDGALWVADIGDNVTSPTRRPTIALWRIPPEGGPPVIHRLTYPDGPHDAEALLFDSDGTPVVVTKELGDTSHVYQAERALEAGTALGVPLRLVGEFHPVLTGTANDLGAVADLMVTGAATAPDRTRVALRTYTTAYEWDVLDGDVVKSITTTTPRTTPLPADGQGEAIAYTTDGEFFLTLADTAGPTAIRRYPRASTDDPGPVGPATALATVTEAGRPAPTTRYVLGPLVAANLALVGGLAWLLARRRRD